MHPAAQHVATKGPSVVKEIAMGLSLGVAVASCWKVLHWREQRRTKEFYEMLARGEISVVHDE